MPPHGPHHYHHHGPPHHGRHHRHDPHRHWGAHDRLVDTLRLLCDVGRFESVEALATVAANLGPDGAAAAEYLRAHCARVAVPLAIDKLDIHRREEAHLRWTGLLELASKGTVALIAPLPPHIFDAFAVFDRAMVISPDGHEPPPHLRSALAGKMQTGIYESRPFVRQANLVLFDAFVDGGGIWVRRCVTDLLDPLSPAVQLGAHFRPHKFPEDTLASEEVQRRIMPI